MAGALDVFTVVVSRHFLRISPSPWATRLQPWSSLPRRTDARSRVVATILGLNLKLCQASHAVNFRCLCTIDLPLWKLCTLTLIRVNVPLQPQSGVPCHLQQHRHQPHPHLHTGAFYQHAALFFELMSMTQNSMKKKACSNQQRFKFQKVQQNNNTSSAAANAANAAPR
ncbi:hypothetical protein LY76DRAFT_32850 [Colletotrichum caudatum]|nr:hypothetical protein LY76DRAFT_32850 [Colletotrichum caudatum]